MTDLETRLMAGLADTARRNLADDLAVPVFDPEPAGPARNRWLVPALAAAVVVAVAVGVLFGANRLHRAAPPATNRSITSGTVVTLAVAGDIQLSQAQLQAAATLVSGRAIALGFPDRTSAQVDGADRIDVFIPGSRLTAAQLRLVPALAATDELQYRPLLTDPIQATTSTSGASSRPVADPWRSLGFNPPADATELGALAPVQRQKIQSVLKAWDCGNLSPNATDRPMIACDRDGSEKYLLGPAIIGSGDVADASAISPGDPRFEWTVIVGLKSNAQQRWTSYTAQHNETVHAGAVENQVADVLDGQVIVSSTIQSEIAGDTQVSGGFTEDSAKTLAAALANGPLPAAFTVQSVQAR